MPAPDSPLSSLGRATLPASAIAAFAATPLLRFADPAVLWAGGYALATAVIVLVISQSLINQKWLMRAGGALAGLGLAILFYLGDTGMTASKANDKRCLAIQRDMLSAQPRRDDGPDLFQALGCRPQGEGSIYAKLRTPALPHQDRTRGNRQIESTASPFQPTTSFKLGSP